MKKILTKTRPAWRARQRGIGRGSLLGILLIAGIAAFMVWPLLHSKWLSPAPAFKPGQDQASSAVATQPVGAKSHSYAFTWPALPAEGAPELSLRIATTDWFTALSDRPYEIREENGSPKRVLLTLLHPNAEAQAKNGICRESETPFAGCTGGLAVLDMVRSADALQVRNFLLGLEKPAAQDAMPYAERRTQALVSFWTKTDKGSGLETFQGWDCSDANRRAREEMALFFALPTGQEAGCFRLHLWWEKLRPAWFGYQLQQAFFECSPYTGCNSGFLFQQRLVNIRYEYIAEREASQTRTRMVVSAWQLLNRLRESGKQKDSVINTAEAEAQLANCQAYIAEAARWPQTSGAQQTPDKVSYFLRAACKRVAETALELLAAAPAKALPLLRGVIPPLQQSTVLQSRNTALLDSLYSGQLQALDATGQGESPEALETVLAAIALAGGMKSEEEMARIEVLLPQALALSRRLGTKAPVSARSTLFASINRYYDRPENYAKWQALYLGLTDDTAAAYGNESPELIEPLRTLGWKNWRANDFAGLKNSTDRLAAVMLAQPLPGSGSDAASEAARQREGAAFDAVFFYRNYGLHEKRLGEAAGLIAPLVARLGNSLGPEAPQTKAARYHQQEVVTGRAGNGPIGGGFLSY